MNQSSLTDADQDTIERAEELAALTGADAIRQWAGAESYDVASTLSAYTEALGAAQALIFDLIAITRRLNGEPETYTCVLCGATISVFIDHGDGWHHYRGSGTAADPIELYDAGHPATLSGMIP